MEYIHGKISLKRIFLHNDNWKRFYAKNKHRLREAINLNVLKMLICRTSILGYHLFECFECGTTKKVRHTCKSKFCSSCGQKATEIWIQDKLEKFPQTKWQHITFTMPNELWPFFWVNRHLFGKISLLAANIIINKAKLKNALPGIFAALHTFGRDLKRNVHIHLSATCAGLSLSDKKTWIKNIYYHHEPIKKEWRYAIINLLRNEYKNGNLIMPPKQKHITNQKEFNTFLNKHYSTKWVVHLQKTSENQIQNIQYLGKYLKRPPIGETRIEKYEKGEVTFNYLDHYDKVNKKMTLDVNEFIERVVSHIQDKHFRCIRYYGFLANRVIGQLLAVVHHACKKKFEFKKKDTSWRTLHIKEFGVDPLICKKCSRQMFLTDIQMPIDISKKELQIIFFTITN